jgi:putative phage-type endonuclease
MTKQVLAKTTALTKEEWLALRQNGIGGSDCAAACGMSRFKSPYTLWAEKTGMKAKDDLSGNESVYWGTVMEPILRTEFAKRTGLAVQEIPYVFCDKETPFMIANIDGIAKDTDGNVSLLEIKTAGLYAAKDWADGLPPEYYLQVQHYLSVCGLNHAYVIVLIGGNDFKYIEVERDDTTIANLIMLERDFWEAVTRKEAPAVDGSSSTADTLSELYPKGNKTSLILPDSADELARYYLDLHEQEKELKTEKTACENQLKAMLGESDCALTPAGYAISWKNSTSSRIDTTLLKKEVPDVAAKYSKTTTCRKFSVKEIKGAE